MDVPALGRSASISSDHLVLALDQGTTNAKALLLRPDRTVLAAASRPVPVAYPQPGWVEQSAATIWTATVTAATDCLARAGNPPIAGIAISTQRESAVVWSERTGQPLGPVLGWQDARTAARCETIAAAHGTAIARRTGLPVDPMYSAPKMRWLLDEALRLGADLADIRVGTVDSWLCWNLTGRFAAEAGNASRTLLFDLETLGWHPDLLEIFGIPDTSLATVTRSDGDFGVVREDSGLPAGVPVLAVMADSHAAMLAQGCTTPGLAKATYGTGSSIMTPIVDPARARPTGITTTLAWLTDLPVYAYEGNIIASGAALDWMCRTLGLPGGAELAALASTVETADGVSFVPAFAGLGAPWWDRGAVGTISGISAGTTPAHLARAALDAVAHQVADVVEAIEAGGAATIGLLAADGGATASPLLMQTQADLLGRRVRVSDIAEASALGAAMLGYRRLGAPEPNGAAESAGTYTPLLPEGDRLARRRAWASAVARARLTTTG